MDHQTSFKLTGTGKDGAANYQAVSSTPGRDGTTVEVDILVGHNSATGHYYTKADFGELMSRPSVEETLDHLANILQRTADAIKARQKIEPIFPHFK